MGSVKDLEIIKSPTQNEMGVERFRFSDRYSVFDWGEMPDTIEGKGSALCVMGAFCFEELEKEGIKTHYRGVVDQTGRLTRTHNLHEPTNIMEIDLVRVIHPSLVQGRTGMMHDYSSYTPNLVNFLIPLEVIYRNSLPQGSSIFKRLKTGEITPSDLGLNHTPREGEDLKEPFFDLSTKLEERDRYLSFKEAKEISGIRESELQEIKEKLRIVNNLITKVAVKAGLKNEDGKIELAFDPKRELMVVDVVGTLDECRFTYQGLHVSKEVARQFYMKLKWYVNVLQAKEEARERGTEDWKALCRS